MREHMNECSGEQLFSKPDFLVMYVDFLETFTNRLFSELAEIRTSLDELKRMQQGNDADHDRECGK